MDIFKDRRSIRKYKSDPVPEDLLRQVVDAGLWAATGKGSQSPVIIAVTDRDLRDRLEKANTAILGVERETFYGAPAVLIVLADKSAPTYVYDGSLALGNMMLKAYELGLGSCWIHRAKQEFEGEIGKEILERAGLTGEYEGIGHLILGWPDEQPAPKPRKEGRAFYL